VIISETNYDLGGKKEGMRQFYENKIDGFCNGLKMEDRRKQIEVPAKSLP
jgi:hypothetical protein